MLHGNGRSPGFWHTMRHRVARAFLLVILIFGLAMGAVGMWSREGVPFLIAYGVVVLCVIGIGAMAL